MKYLRTMLFAGYLIIPLLVVVTLGQDNIFIALAMIPFIAGIPFALRKEETKSVQKPLPTLQVENGNSKFSPDGTMELAAWSSLVLPWFLALVLAMSADMFLMAKVSPVFLIIGESIISFILMIKIVRKLFPIFFPNGLFFLFVISYSPVVVALIISLALGLIH